MSNAAARVLFSGDVCGKLDVLAKRVASVNKNNGPFDALVCVGQFLPSDAEGIEEMEEYLQGKKAFPVPTYFTGDYGEGAGILLSDARAEAAKVGLTSKGIRVCDNLFWLKGSGILNLKGLRVAFLSGKHDATVYRDPKAAASAGAHHEDDVDFLRAMADDPGVIDVFISNEWPSGILKGADRSAVPAELSQPAPGISTIAEIAAELKPRYHIAGSEGVFYAREPYSSLGVSHVTRFIGLGSVGNDNKQKFIHALSLTPASRLTAGEIGAKVANTTSSPYDWQGEPADPEGLKSATKRATNLSSQENDPEGQYWRYSESKRQKTGDGSGRDRVCFEFVSKGSCSRGTKCHFMHDVNGTPIPRGSCFDFITKGSCEKGDDCRYRHSLEPGTEAKRPAEPCWFCLSNATVDAHLVISVGDHCYCAMAKGPLVPGHVLILPIEHFPSTVSLPPGTLLEVEVYKEALKKCFHSQEMAVVIFERYLQLRAGTHAHLQVVPVPLAKASGVQRAFEEAGKNVGLEFQVFPAERGAEAKEALKTLIGGGVNYFSVELPNGTILAHPLASGEKIPMQFGREVLAALLEMPERGDWKACKLSKEKETAMVDDFKDQFQQFDPDEE